MWIYLTFQDNNSTVKFASHMEPYIGLVCFFIYIDYSLFIYIDFREISQDKVAMVAITVIINFKKI